MSFNLYRLMTAWIVLGIVVAQASYAQTHEKSIRTKSNVVQRREYYVKLVIKDEQLKLDVVHRDASRVFHDVESKLNPKDVRSIRLDDGGGGHLVGVIHSREEEADSFYLAFLGVPQTGGTKAEVSRITRRAVADAWKIIALNGRFNGDTISVVIGGSHGGTPDTGVKSGVIYMNYCSGNDVTGGILTEFAGKSTVMLDAPAEP